jgi:hypothetical protein
MRNQVFTFKYKLEEVVDGAKAKVEKTGSAESVQFDNIADAISFYEKDAAGKGESLVLEIINSTLQNKSIANERAKLLRGPNPWKLAKDRAKSDPQVAAEFNALLAKLGLPTL